MYLTGGWGGLDGVALDAAPDGEPAAASG
jgi:hypothetical protein